MIRILFVCHGNICRSPMAEFVMKKMVTEANISPLTKDDFEIASAATSTEEIGNPVYPPARRMLALHGINCNGKTARQMTYRDYEYYDYIILMDKNNLRNLRWILPADVYKCESAYNETHSIEDAMGKAKGKVSLLMDWTHNPRDVADPWYTGNFDDTWRDVNEGCKAFLAQIVKSNA